MKVLDLFSGIGGFSLGLERAGMETVAFCEMDKHCHKVLNKHWPDVPIFKDVRELSSKDFGPGDVDVICGGFPCQDISVGGAGAGLSGERSGLWKEFWRLINEIRPKYAIIENVERLRKKGLGIVLNDLYEIGYDVEWDCITAASIGAPHQRDRLWIVAYSSEQRQHERTGKKRHLQIDQKWESEEIHSDRKQCKPQPGEIRKILSKGAIESIRGAYSSEFSIVPKLHRVTDGIPTGLDESARKQRIKQLGNAVLPQIPEMIGKEILKHERELHA